MSRLAWSFAVALLGVATAQATEDDAGASAAAASLTIAVASFERNAPPGVRVPEIDLLLADRIGTRGVRRIVGPAEFAAEADAEPEDGTVVEWAKRAGVAVVVVGRITRIGNQVSVDVRLRSGETGAAAGTYVVEILQAGGAEGAVDRLAAQILQGAQGLAAGGPAPVAAPATGGGSGAAKDDRFGIRFDGDRPLSIRADELEAIRSDGARQLRFSKNVVVTQDDVTIRSSKLEAFYPPESSQPDRLVARGRVRMTQGESEVRCDQASYVRAEDMLVCNGNAELRDADGCVAGERIEFDLAKETVKVLGGARVVMGGEGDAEPTVCQ